MSCPSCLSTSVHRHPPPQAAAQPPQRLPPLPPVRASLMRRLCWVELITVQVIDVTWRANDPLHGLERLGRHPIKLSRAPVLDPPPHRPEPRRRRSRHPWAAYRGRPDDGPNAERLRSEVRHHRPRSRPADRRSRAPASSRQRPALGGGELTVLIGEPPDEHLLVGGRQLIEPARVADNPTSSVPDVNGLIEPTHTLESSDVLGADVRPPGISMSSIDPASPGSSANNTKLAQRRAIPQRASGELKPNHCAASKRHSWLFHEIGTSVPVGRQPLSRLLVTEVLTRK